MPDESIQLRDQVGVLRRRWMVVATVLALSIGVGALLVLALPRTYSASADVRLIPDPVTQGDLTEEAVATEARAALSFDTVSRTIDELGLSESPEELLGTVTAIPDETGAAVLTITANRSSPSEAADVANTLARTYLDATGAAAQQRLATLDGQIDEVNENIAQLEEELDEATGTSNFAETQFALRQAKAERSLLQGARSSIILSQGEATEAGDIITPAFPPSAPASPQPVRTLALAALVGLMLGIGAAYLREHFDDVVRDEASLDKTLDGVTVLGRIPHLRRKDRREPTTITAPGTPASEAYRALGANVRFLLARDRQLAGASGNGHPTGRVLVVSSASSAEGRTATAVNFAVVTARAGLRTVLIDAELRRPHIGELLQVPDGPGLADVLAGTARAKEALVNGDLENLAVLPAGAPPANPAELLASPRLAQLLDDVSDKADLVIVHSPAVLSAADTLEMARRADMTVLAVREDVSRRRNVAEAVSRLGQVGANVAGIVLIDVNRGSAQRASL